MFPVHNLYSFRVTLHRRIRSPNGNAFFSGTLFPLSCLSLSVQLLIILKIKPENLKNLPKSTRNGSRCRFCVLFNRNRADACFFRPVNTVEWYAGVLLQGCDFYSTPWNVRGGPPCPDGRKKMILYTEDEQMFRERSNILTGIPQFLL